MKMKKKGEEMRRERRFTLSLLPRPQPSRGKSTSMHRMDSEWNVGFINPAGVPPNFIHGLSIPLCFSKQHNYEYYKRTIVYNSHTHTHTGLHAWAELWT